MGSIELDQYYSSSNNTRRRHHCCQPSKLAKLWDNQVALVHWCRSLSLFISFQAGEANMIHDRWGVIVLVQLMLRPRTTPEFFSLIFPTLKNFKTLTLSDFKILFESIIIIMYVFRSVPTHHVILVCIQKKIFVMYVHHVILVCI